MMNESPKKLSSKEKWILFFILIVAAFLRFYDLESESLWNDELSTWKRASLSNVSETIQFSRKYDVHPAGYQVFMHVWVKTFGDSEKSLRTPSAIAGLFAVLLIFLFTRKIFTTQIALASSWFLAISWFPLYYAREARSYSLLLMAALLIVWIGELYLKHKSKWYGILLGFCLLLAAYLHYFGLLFAVGYMVFMILRSASIKAHIIPLSIFIIGYLPWLPYLFLQQGYGPIYITLPSFFDFFRWIRLVLANSNLVLLLFSLTFAFAVFKKNHAFQSPISFWMLSLWLFLPWVIAYIISAFLFPVLTFPNMIIALPAMLILLAAVPLMVSHSRVLFLGWILIVTSFNIYDLFFDRQFFHSPQKQEIREAVYHLNQEANVDELIFVTAWDIDYLNYYLNHFGSDLHATSLIYEESDLSKIKSALENENHTQFWHIILHRRPQDALQVRLEEEFQRSQQKEFRGAKVSRYMMRK